mgnify:CR=1 FL=1
MPKDGTPAQRTLTRSGWAGELALSPLSPQPLIPHFYADAASGRAGVFEFRIF